MFAAPPAVTAEVFAEIPERYRKRGAANHWIDVQFPGQDIPSFLEGPCFDAHGNLWVVDIPWGRLFRIEPDGTVDLAFEYDGHPNGLKFLPDGRALIADGQNGLMVFDPVHATIEPYLTRDLLEPFLGLNDLTVATNGDIWFTDMGLSGLQNPNGRLFRLSADGRLDCMLDGLPSPNGLVLNKAETVLYLACTRTNAVWKCPIMPDGSLARSGSSFSSRAGRADLTAWQSTTRTTLSSASTALAPYRCSAPWSVNRSVGSIRPEASTRRTAPSADRITRPCSSPNPSPARS